MIALFITTLTIFANPPKYCDIQGQQPIKKIQPKKIPDYFFKTSPDGRYIFYISGKQNYRIDTKTLEEVETVGNYDPVPSPDFKFLTYLENNFSLGMVHLWDDNAEINYSTRYTSPYELTYQSVGALGEDKYRIFSFDRDQKGWSYFDIRFDPYGGMYSFTTLNDRVKINGTEKYRLAMMSKTGQEMIAYNYDNKKTEILKITSNNSEVVDSLPIGGGKGDFSYDSQKVVFHYTIGSENEIQDEINFSPIQMDKSSRNIFVFDRKNKKLKLVTNFNQGNAFFPVFLKNNQIVYLYQTPEKKYEFHYINEPSDSTRSEYDIVSCVGIEETKKSLDKLVTHWLNACLEWTGKSNQDFAKQAILGLPGLYCLELAQVAGLNKKLANDICISKAPSTPPKKPAQEATPNSEGRELLLNKCSICHIDDIPFNSPKALATWGERIKNRINSNDSVFKMPKNDSLSNDEKTKIFQYLESLLK